MTEERLDRLIISMFASFFIILFVAITFVITHNTMLNPNAAAVQFLTFFNFLAIFFSLEFFNLNVLSDIVERYF
jgi:hypothetical protein